MELCTPPPISKSPPPLHATRFSPTTVRFQPLLRSTTHRPLLYNHPVFSFGLKLQRGSSLRSTKSEEISSDATAYVEDDSKTVDEAQLVENTDDYESGLDQELQEGSLFDNPLKLLKFLEGLNIKLDYEETYTFLAFGSGGAVALWLVAAILSAIDSIPVLPKALELVGLVYTLWFSSRYLILKKNRGELLARVEELKQQVLGSEDD
ncbi:protein CURVATURE THYLAKOID 1D, chloroplastic-like [Salvia divinorum]|uniref:Protein CURVATURE THYLAKOID 1D, chloroplastic-like n=1 Tax=Salvia divinorum TaxID=28513 RepID=A0ABD1IHV8_SALDI